MARVREDDISNEVLIYEVQLRPALYDKSDKEYADPSVKTKLWDEVTLKVFSTLWQQLPPEEKLEAGRLVQRRWKNLRTCFSRELHRQHTEKLEKRPKRRRPYIHFEELLFLLPFVQEKEASKNFEAQENNEIPNQLRRNPTAKTAVKGEEAEVEVLLHAESIEREELEVYTAVAGSPKNKKIKAYVDNQPDVFTAKNRTNYDIGDSEKLFALSLVPLLKALAPHQKLDAQIQILQVFRNFHNESTR